MTAACALIQETPGWPAELPPQSYYESVYAADRHNQEVQSKAGYLLWVKRFYRGWGGIPGWFAIREQVLADVEPDRRDEMAARLNDLGRRIAGEWAKASDRRAILATTVQVWIDAAHEAGAHGDHERLLQQISADVDALLADTMEPAAIRLSRYYPHAEPPPSVGAIGREAER